jgi:periplasmic protein TonB
VIGSSSGKEMDMHKKYESLNLEEVSDQRAKSSRGGESGAPRAPRPPVEVHLADGLVENFHLKRPRRLIDVFASAVGHTFVVALLLLIPLVYTHALNLPQFEKTFLVAPPPPPAPPPPAVARLIQHRPKSFFNEGKLFTPKFIPKHIEQVKEEAQPATPTISGVPGGVPGGIPGGQIGGVLGGILGGNSQILPPPPPKPQAHEGPYHVGGRVQAPQLIHEVQPVYPPLAKAVKIHGDVLIDSVIDEHGDVTQMKVVSGSPLLVTAALDAVEQWKYKPTLLNGTPIAVEMEVTVHFELGS